VGTNAQQRTGMRTTFAALLIAALGPAPALTATEGWAKGGRKDKAASYDRFEEVEGLFDASGAAQLADGRLMLVTDSRTMPISFLRLDGNRCAADIWAGETIANRSGGKVTLLSDLEEVAVSREGFVYVLSSHGKEGADSFARFRVDGDRMENVGIFTGLKGVMAAAHPALARAAAIQDAESGFNIEGFVFDRDGRRGLIGFRSPLVDNKAMVVALDNPAAMFADRAAPQVGDVMLLDLGGDGIRGMAWLPKINGYLIASRMDSPAGKGPFRLWFWSGDPQAKPRAVSIDGLKAMRRPEGIAPIVIDGEERILLVSDEGNMREGKPSRIAVIDYDRLRIAP
jgi:hypothetical protein